MARRAKAGATLTGRLRAADPFELIRWLARSQPDPRKALAELVQNSIDAGARNVRITRLRKGGVTALEIVDDGDGVIPELERTEALHYIATNIGHSRKRNLTPDQRRELMLQGKYGIGLLGFWSIGGVMQIRSFVPGQPAHVLRLFEDSSRYEIDRVRGRLALDQRRTEVVVSDLHRSALASLSARRVADYLGSELRGQILAHAVKILVHDRIARGRAPKVLEVIPRRFDGERLALPEEIATEGYGPLRVELYLVPGGQEGGRVAVACSGTTVYDDVTQIEIADFQHMPWTEQRLAGVLDFADFQVPPGTRRGVMPDSAAMAFVGAVRRLEPEVRRHIEAVDERAAAEIEASMLRQLERAFREVSRLAPEYDFFAVRGAAFDASPRAGDRRGSNGGPDGGEADGATAGELPPGVELSAAAAMEEEGADDGGDRLPLAGPLASAEIVPNVTRVERLGERRLRAVARDADGLVIDRPLDVRWSCPSEHARLAQETGKATRFCAGGAPGTVSVFVRISENGHAADAQAEVEIVDEIAESAVARTGIPEPAFVDDPAGAWRSRMNENRWEVNSGHTDFRIAAESSRRKLRYLASLLAKEIVLHSFPSPQLGTALERLVGVLAITERRLEKGAG